MNATLAKLVSPLVWRIPGHGARKLFSFAMAEQASMLDLKAAARLSPSPERRAAYVRHLLDETRHAQMFTLRSAELRRKDGKDSYGFPHADIEDLFERLGEVRFLAFVHLGEGRGRRQFEAYRDWFAQIGDVRSRALFEAIIKDERQHESYTWDLLVAMTGGEKAAFEEVRKARLWEAWRLWRRAGRFLAEKVYTVLMIGLYAMTAPFTLVARVARPVKRGWVMPSGEVARDSERAPEQLALPPTT